AADPVRSRSHSRLIATVWKPTSSAALLHSGPCERCSTNRSDAPCRSAPSVRVAGLLHQEESRLVLMPPNQALQRAAIGIKCSAAGDLASRSPQPRRARVLQRRRAVAELGS